MTAEEVNELKEELTELVEGLEEEEENEEDLIEDLTDLKHRVNLMEKEMKDLSQALKQTVLDVRSLISEMDNPFNYLRSIGVDKLVEKALENAEEELNKAKKEAIKDRIKKKLNNEEEKQTAPAALLPTMLTPPEPVEPSLELKPLVNEQVATNAETMTTENTPGNSNIQVNQTIPLNQKTFKRQISPSQAPTVAKSDLSAKHEARPSLNQATSVNRSITRVLIAAAYLLIKIGEEDAEKLLGQYVMKGWIRPDTAKEVLDAMHVLASHSEKLQFRREIEEDGEIGIDDHLLIVTLLNSLDGENSEWSDTLLTLLLARVGLLTPLLKLPFKNR